MSGPRYDFGLLHPNPLLDYTFYRANENGARGRSNELLLRVRDRGESVLYVYEIRIQGHPDQHWLVWFDGLTISNESDGSARLASPLVDEAALHGVLIKVRDLALPLLALSRVAAHGAERKPLRHLERHAERVGESRRPLS
jgi:hypothetical protein